MKYRCFHLIFFCLISLFFNQLTANGRSPNVVLILTDDQGFGDVQSHGNKLIETPVHDRIASEGARFDRFYVSPVCAPTRASLLTGRYHIRTGVHGVTRGHEMMRADEVTIAELLKGAGYATGCFGKWHNGSQYPHHPNGQGFDEFLGFCAGHWNNYFDATLDRNGKKQKTNGFIIDALTDAAIDFIESNSDRSFFAIFLTTHHTPLGKFLNGFGKNIVIKELMTCHSPAHMRCARILMKTWGEYWLNWRILESRTTRSLFF